MSKIYICKKCGKKIPSSDIYVLRNGETVCWNCLRTHVEKRLDSENKEKVVKAIKELGQLYREAKPQSLKEKNK